MAHHEFPKEESIEEHVPDGEAVVNVLYVGGTEQVETEEYGYHCHECDEVFETEEERNGHMSVHSED